MIRHPSKLSFFASGVITGLLILVFLNIKSHGQTDLQSFEDGKTIVSEISFEGLDSDFEVDTPGLEGPIRERAARELFKDRSTGTLLNLPLNRLEVGKGIKALKKWLFNQGYIDAEVTAYGEILSPGNMRIIYSVQRHEITKVREIRFSGNTRLSDQDLRTAFGNSKRDFWQIYSPSRFDYIYQKFILQNLLFKQGFFKARVRTERVQYLPDGIVVTVGIKEGPRFRNGNIVVEGNTVFERKQILKFLDWIPGEIPDGMKIRNSVFETLKKQYTDRGYINYSPNLIPTFNEPSESGDDGIVDIEITINEGYRYSISKLVIEGADQEDEVILRNYLKIVPGEFGWYGKLRKGIDKIKKLNEFGVIYQGLELRLREDSREVIAVLRVSKID